MNEDKDKDCLDHENNSKYCFFKVANAFLLLANVILIIFAGAYLPSKALNVDYTAITVAVFGILITVLIGWQIYNAVNIESRISKAERQLNDTFNRLQATETNIEKNALSSEKYSTAVNCMACALTNYYQIRLDKEIDIKSKAREFCVSYNMSVRAITYLLESEKKPSLIIPWIQVCTNIMEQCINELTKEQYADISGYAPRIMNDRCDTAHKLFNKHIEMFDNEFIDRIAHLRNKRKEILNGKYSD